MKRTISFIVLMVLMAGMVMAQNVNDGFAKLNQKEYSAAKQIFAGLLKADPKNSAALYGMGEYYYYTGKMDSAKILFQNGIDANSSYGYNYAGLGKISFASDPVAAEGYFKDAIKKSKKDVGPIIAIAKFYYEKTPKNYTEAQRYIDMAIAIDAKSGPAYFLDGLIDFDQSKTSDAALNFDRSIYFDPNHLEAYLYSSQIMAATRNLPKAVEYLNKALAINPKYWIAYKALGELYYDNRKYPEAITNFDIYFKNITPPDSDITHYAYSLFFNKQYDQAREMIDKLLVKNPNDYVLLRLIGYISFETKDLVNGKAVMDKFFQLVPADKILTDDYAYYGKMLSAAGNDSLAIENYQLALKKDSTQFQMYDEISKSYNKLKQFEPGLQYSSLYFKKKPNRTSADYFNLGKAYYSTGNSMLEKNDSLVQNTDPVKHEADSLKQIEYYTIADSLFAKVEELSPTSYLGPFWRARVNSAIDKETTLGLAKPFYEKALEIIILDPVKYAKAITEVYAYLGFYYYVKEDKATSIEYWKKLLEIEPTNVKAQEALNSLEKK
ncbi:MAG TPA: tetratricopeptide repeat protein [Prolixibacteraceae bacterium]|jgi:tetratricopeptide (TPR) repeat protein